MFSQLRALVKGDLIAQKPKSTGFLSVLFYARRPGFGAILLYRLSAICFGKGLLGRIASLLLVRMNLIFHACDIDPRAVIGPGFVIGHTVGLVIGRATIGRNFRVQQNVTIGVRDITDRNFNVLPDGQYNPASYPTIGDNVTVCAGAVVLGSIRIGNGAMIGANSVVLQDVPEGCLAVGVPARLIVKTKVVV